MAFDGLCVCALAHELNEALSGGRINKIAQTEKDELFFTIKSFSGTQKLLVSVNASLPLVYLTDTQKPAPLTAPGFCMLLRKHLNNGRIISVTQPGLERILDIKVEHLDEMGDLCTKHIMIELMGKHSNIIFIDDNNRIIDSIKRINAGISSVREVLPGGKYFIPNTADKIEPLTVTSSDFINALTSKPVPVSKAIYTSFTGISPVVAESICNDAGLDSTIPASALLDRLSDLFKHFQTLMADLKKASWKPSIYYENNRPKEFCVVPLSVYPDLDNRTFATVSEMLEAYYSEKNSISRVRNRSADLRQVVTTLLEKDYKKLALQERQLLDTEKRDTFRIYGELLNTYGYNIPEGSKEFEALNYYDNTMIIIPLDSTLTVRENSVKYFAKYNKLKRTFEAMTVQVEATRKEIAHLESIETALDIAVDYDDLLEIRKELETYGFVKKKNDNKKGQAAKITSKPWHYISSDGFDIFVGKNNIQNEELTFKIATGSDWWFHAKDMPGSHVIVKCGNREMPDKTFEEAAALAAYYSKGRNQPKVEIDYIQKQHVKKVAGAAPGFVIYHTNYSMNIAPDISEIKEG